jgi:hypothetical protein
VMKTLRKEWRIARYYGASRKLALKIVFRNWRYKRLGL